PAPSTNPDPNPDDDPDNDNTTTKENDSTTTEAECTTTSPPECTKTISYISEGTGYSSTVYGTCPPVTGCVSGDQSTTTTTVASEVPVIWGDEVPDDGYFGDAEDIDEDTEDYFEGVFDDNDISLEDEQNMGPEAECSGDLQGVPASCFTSIYPTFCQEVDQDQSKQLTKNLTSNDIDTGSSEKRSRLDMQRRRLLARDDDCLGWTFEFDWSGAQGDCDQSCSDSMDTLEAQCIEDKTYNQGNLDVGCGTYKFTAVFDESAASPTTTSAPLTSVVLTNLPTLTDVGTTISTPDGSSCASTATVTQCVIGSGGQSACAERPTCASWVNTQVIETTEIPATTTEPPPVETTSPPQTPLELKPVVCENEADFPGHADVSPSAQNSYADLFCEIDTMDNGVTDMGPGDEPLERVRLDQHEITYYYSVSWIDGCVTSVDRQDVAEPLGSDGMACKDILVKAYSDCTNGGVGGYIDAGCLRYQFIGAK
ncbi:hypothetical protein B0T10DRAFT_399106, partial [Thelonectria olida]